ncbi:hypothetical protein ACQW02_24570 [Humitalea sp. 24SJ18S-53]|uniref:hypothetical protein n=1 Tax=Humitalea sp. 24SJ18S-53 TaxID=3422307 RepID=UPI003D6780AE
MHLRVLRQFCILLALALCLQSSLAMAHCLRLTAADQPFHVEICTAEGLVLLDLAEPQDTERHQDRAFAGFCLACHGLPGIALPAVAEVPGPRMAPILLPPLPRLVAAPLGARAPPYPPTGPPILS